MNVGTEDGVRNTYLYYVIQLINFINYSVMLRN
jgi:hypothetical protein